MDITQDELRYIYNLGMQAGKESMGYSRTDRYQAEMEDYMRSEYKSMREFLHFVHMHYPQAIKEYEAVEKIKES